MKIKKILYLCFLFVIANFSQESEKKYLSPRNANYDISVKLDVEKKVLTATQKLNWKNIASTPVSELQFHLYLNAFKNSKSTFMRESKGEHREYSYDADSSNWGWIDIDSIIDEEGKELAGLIEFIHPDDDNYEDQTVIKIPLDKAVLPGQAINLEIAFTAKLPKIMARTGYSDNYFLVAQWFPKIGVFEDKGERGRKEAGWNCHQFHANSEFFADFGVYNVDMTLPEEFVVGATGVLQEEIKNDDGTKTLKFKADDVIDFAWTASPLFEIVNDKWKNVDIKLLLQPQHLSQADRHIESVKYAFEYFEKNLGEYPYPSLTIVDPPFRGLGSAGMEYPMFITAGCFWGIPDGLKLTEMLTIHEFGHNYFMGILATNEFEEAWLDEGFNTYFEKRIMDHYYGKKTSMLDFLGYTAGNGELNRNRYVGMNNPQIAEINRPSWTYTEGGYGAMSYKKPAVVLETFENLVSTPVMDKIMKTYFERWKFKHPGTQDFIDIAKEVVNEEPEVKNKIDVEHYFDQLLNTSEVCDYEVSSIRIDQEESIVGVFDSDDGKDFQSGEDQELYNNKVIVTRLGEIRVPQEILVHFEDGKEIRKSWNGMAKIKTFEFENNEKIKWAKIDPDNKISIDISFLNNSLTLEPETGAIWKYAVKMLFWIQNTMLTTF